MASSKRTDNVRREATWQLRKMALEAKDGAFLGSESDLLRQLEVSRPTLRQALRLLEHEQLVSVRMGPLGGCYAARPAVESVVRSASTYLQVKGTTLYEMLQVFGMLTVHVMSLAAACEDQSLRDTLAAFSRKIEGQQGDLTPEEFQLLEIEFMTTVGAMAANRSLDLFLQVMERVIDLNPDSRMLVTEPMIIRLRRRMWLQMVDAILSGDQERSRQLSEQQFELITGAIPPQALGRSMVGKASAAASTPTTELQND